MSGSCFCRKCQRNKHEGSWMLGIAKWLNTQERQAYGPFLSLACLLLLWDLWKPQQHSFLSLGYKVPDAKGCASNFRWSQRSMRQTYTSESNIWPVVLWSFSEYWILTIKNTWKVFNSNQTSPSLWKINLPQFCCFLEVINIPGYVLNSPVWNSWNFTFH